MVDISAKLNKAIEYFDLQSHRRGVARGQAEGADAPKLAVVPQYLAASAGIVADPYIQSYIADGAFNATFAELWPRIIFGLLVGLAILPGVYRKAFDPDNPTLVQFGALFASGLGWQSLFSAGAKGLGG